MNPSDAIEAIENRSPPCLTRFPVTSRNICANSPVTNPCTALWVKAGPVNPHSVMHCFRGGHPGQCTHDSASGHAAIHLMTRLQDELRTESVRTQTRGLPVGGPDI